MRECFSYHFVVATNFWCIEDNYKETRLRSECTLCEEVCLVAWFSWVIPGVVRVVP